MHIYRSNVILHFLLRCFLEMLLYPLFHLSPHLTPDRLMLPLVELRPLLTITLILVPRDWGEPIVPPKPPRRRPVNLTLSIPIQLLKLVLHLLIA